MNELLTKIEQNFIDNVNSVYELMDFDRIVLDYSINAIEDLGERLKQHHNLNNPQFTAINTLKQLRNIRKNDSLRLHYDTIFNQCIVLLVSYFGSTMADIFKNSLNDRLNRSDIKKLAKEEIKISLGELQETDYNLSECIGDIIVNKKDISFQDMQSISRAFKEYFEFDIVKDIDVNNIIMAQACRHIIVHAGSIVSDRMLKQVRNAQPRYLKESVGANERILFNTGEIRIAGDSMIRYVKVVKKQVLDSQENWG